MVADRASRPIGWCNSPLTKFAKISRKSRDIKGLNQTLQIRWEFAKCIESLLVFTEF